MLQIAPTKNSASRLACGGVSLAAHRRMVLVSNAGTIEKPGWNGPSCFLRCAFPWGEIGGQDERSTLPSCGTPRPATTRAGMHMCVNALRQMRLPLERSSTLPWKVR